MRPTLRRSILCSALLIFTLSTLTFSALAFAQDDQSDPPTRVARLGFLEGSVSFLPAGENEWVGAVPNRPMTTGDQLWTDAGARAEVQLGSAVLRLGENTSFSFLNLDDHNIQVQLSSGALNVRVRRFGQNDYFEVDTPNLALTLNEPGSYRMDASPDGNYTVVSLRNGSAQVTGGGQSYTIDAGQRISFSGTDQLDAEFQELTPPDPLDAWAMARDRRWDESRSAAYLSRDIVGYDDLDQYGQWRDDANYGHVWYPTQVEMGWAPYHVGHWDWISPWGYTWVDDSPWGYAPFHYGRWVSVAGRWGWVAGPVDVAPVYAPALVVFIGGGPGGWGGNVGWFPLGPREVYIPPYAVSRNYMTQVNVSNTRVNVTNVTNVYNETIVNKSVNVTNITYANRNVQGAVTVVPQQAFAGAQPVAHAAVKMNAEQLARVPIATHVAVAPTRQAVLGAKASTAGHVSAPPVAVANRQVVAKKTPPPPSVPFAKQQQALAAHPGQPVPRAELQSMRPAQTHPMVKQAPPAKPATPVAAHGNPQNRPQAGRPETPPPAGNRTAPQPENRTAPAENRPPQEQENRPPAPAQPNRPAEPARPAEPNRPAPPPANRAAPAENRPAPAQPNRPAEPARPAEPNRPALPQANRPTPPEQQNRPAEHTRPEPNKPAPPPANRPTPPPNRPEPQAQHPPERTPPPAAKPAPPAKQTPEQKKQQEEEDRKKHEKPPGF